MPEAPPLPAPPGARTARWVVLAVAAVAAVVAACSPRDLWAPDEPRYGEVAREMLERGRWLVPHANDEPYAEKPPLYFWLAAGVSAPGGEVTAVTARLAAALLAAGAVLLTARLARRLFGDPEVAATAALLFASTGYVAWQAPRAALDLPLTFFVLATVERLHAWWAGAGTGATVLAGVAWAGAVLVKGPVGLFLPPLVLAGGMLAAGRGPAGPRRGWLVAPLVLAALGLAWLLPALAHGGDAYGDRLLGQIGDRATGAEVGHRRPVWYYAERIVPLTLPWCLHLLAGLLLALGLRRADREDRFGLGAALAGSVGYLLVLTAIATKRELYVLPGLPFAAVLAALALHRGRWPRLVGLGGRVAILVVAGLAVGLAAGPWLVPLVRPGVELPGLAVGVESILRVAVPALLLGLAALLAWRRRADAVALARVLGIGFLVGATAWQVLFLPLVDPVKSFRNVADAADVISGGGPVHIAGWNQAPNLLWSLDRTRVEVLRDDADLARALAPDAPRCAVVAQASWWEEAKARAAAEDPERAALFARVPVAWDHPVDHRHLLVLANAPPQGERLQPTGAAPSAGSR